MREGWKRRMTFFVLVVAVAPAMNKVAQVRAADAFASYAEATTFDYTGAEDMKWLKIRNRLINLAQVCEIEAALEDGSIVLDLTTGEIVVVTYPTRAEAEKALEVIDKYVVDVRCE